VTVKDAQTRPARDAPDPRILVLAAGHEELPVVAERNGDNGQLMSPQGANDSAPLEIPKLSSAVVEADR
jgi:hypothetical protein